MFRRIALLGALCAFSAPAVVSATAAPAPVAGFPSKYKREFTKGCLDGASEEGLSKKKARVYCRASLKCLERELTLSEFKDLAQATADGDKTPPHRRVVQRCTKEAAKTL